MGSDAKVTFTTFFKRQATWPQSACEDARSRAGSDSSAAPFAAYSHISTRWIAATDAPTHARATAAIDTTIATGATTGGVTAPARVTETADGASRDDGYLPS